MLCGYGGWLMMAMMFFFFVDDDHDIKELQSIYSGYNTAIHLSSLYAIVGWDRRTGPVLYFSDPSGDY